MAPMYRDPIKSRQIEIILPPRPAHGLPAPAEPVSRRISSKVFFSLLAGTLCIFFIAVFFWKIGRVFRAFNRNKVLQGGRPATVQYAKTWHGWTELTKHEERKQRRKDLFKRLRKRLSWKSTHADYSWVYWDPGSREVNRHYEDQKGIRWIPRWLLSYDFQITNTARTNDGSVNHDLHTEGNATQGKQKEKCASRDRGPVLIPSGEMAPWDIEKRDGTSTLRRRRPASSHFRPSFDDTTASEEVYKPSQARSSRHPADRAASQERGITPDIISGSRPGVLHFRSTMLSPRKRSSSMPSFSSASHDQSFVTSVSRQLSVAEDHNAFVRSGTEALFPARLSITPHVYLTKGQSIEKSNKKSDPHGKSLSWKYKAWGARMQLDTFDQTRCFRGYAGRPGSPISDVLKNTLSSGQGTDTSGSFSATNRANNRTSVSTSTRGFGLSTPVEQDATTGLGSRISQDYSTTTPVGSNVNRDLMREPVISRTTTAGATYQFLRARTSHTSAGPSSPLHRVSRSTSSEGLGSVKKTTEKSKPSNSQSRISQRRLSSPEVRLIYNLSRRLEWLSQELNPGRKPFHFPILANHWLNRKTWFVLDPASRVPETSKRLHGDPRAIRSMGHTFIPPRKVKYPNVYRARAYTPRIDSWRLSVNRARKSSGMREFLKSIQLFDGSAEEPPENAVDTASWILRKPPQGFELSTKQKTAYYNSGTGWHETLTDWQKVKRAYRVRKLIHEGRVNRTRIKEIAMGVGGVCQRAARSVTPDWHAFPRSHEGNRLERQERSGSGSIPFRRGILRRQGLPEQYFSTPTTPDDVASAQLPCPIPIDPGGEIGSAEAGSEVVTSERQEQRDTG